MEWALLVLFFAGIAATLEYVVMDGPRWLSVFAFACFMDLYAYVQHLKTPTCQVTAMFSGMIFLITLLMRFMVFLWILQLGVPVWYLWIIVALNMAMLGFILYHIVIECVANSGLSSD